MADGGAGPIVELRLEPTSDQFAADDSRWKAQVAELRLDLHRKVGGVAEVGAPIPGQKGVMLVPLIVALGSSGAFTTMLGALRAWLGRDQKRSIDIVWNVDGQERSVSMRGDAVDNEAVRLMAEAVKAHIGESSPA